MNFIVRFLSIIFCFMLAASISGCGQEDEKDNPNTDSGSAAFSIKWPDDAPTQKTANALGNPTIDCTGITAIKVEVYEDPANSYLTGDSFDCSLGEGTVKGIPVGSNRRVVVSAIGEAETLIYQGEKGNITISKNAITNVGSISLDIVDENELPSASIIQPLGGTIIILGEEITFEGLGEDTEDGLLSGNNLVWESDIDGSIGQGARFVRNNLSAGVHTITLTVTDNDGGVGTTTTRITISLLEIDNSVGMHFNLIPAGTFTMGSPKDEPGRWLEEILHKVTLTRPFYIQTTEVTLGQWEAVMGEGSNPTRDQGYIECGDDCPVEYVSWYDCVIFCNRLSQKEGLTPSYYTDSYFTTVFDGIPPVVDSGYAYVYWNQEASGYRLPTEAQWEYAARAGTTTAFANGDIRFYEDMYTCNYDPNLDAMGWYCDNFGDTNLVAQKNANAWGLFDMHGNVDEWCQDWYGEYTEYDVMDPTGPTDGSERVLRGGSMSLDAKDCRAASRYRRTGPGLRGLNLGFRLSLPPDQPGEIGR